MTTVMPDFGRRPFISITVTFLKISQEDSATGSICPTVTAGQKTISNNDNRALILIRCVADKRLVRSNCTTTPHQESRRVRGVQFFGFSGKYSFFINSRYSE